MSENYAGLRRALKETFEHAQKSGQSGPFDLAERAIDLVAPEIAQLGGQRDKLADAIIGGIEIGDVDSRYHAALHIAGELHEVIRRLGAEVEQLRTAPAAVREVRSVSGDPEMLNEFDEDGNAYDPAVGWDLSGGCRSTIGYRDDQLVAVVHTSDEDKRRGVTHRTVTREQVAHYAWMLLDLVDTTCDGGYQCSAAEHIGGCLSGDIAPRQKAGAR